MKYRVQKESVFWYGYIWREYETNVGGYWLYISDSRSFTRCGCMKKIKRYHEYDNCNARRVEEFEL